MIWSLIPIYFRSVKKIFIKLVYSERTKIKALLAFIKVIQTYKKRSTNGTIL